MAFTQENRLIALDTPLGTDVLLLQGFSGREGISQLFKFDLDVLSTKNDIDFKDIIGQQVTIRVALADGTSDRYFNGFVSRFAQGSSGSQLTNYQMEVVPWVWFLTRIADCRIFQTMTIPDIIQKVFQSRGYSDFKNSLTGSYDPLDYCVQYRETDFNFVSRLMEQYGIFYYFEHEDGKHTMVLADDSSAHQPCPDQESANYNLTSGDVDDDDVITAWSMEQELRTGKYSLTDYNFETPSASLMANEPTVVEVGGNTKFEIYDYPGIHLNSSKGGSVAKIRMQEEEAGHILITGSSVCRAFTSGYKFDLKGHPRDDMNDSYVLTEIQHLASDGSYSQGASRPAQYSNHFTCIPADVPFRPPRITPKPFVQGPQTALVVGKAGEEIWVDKYGRVKVQFYWDRQGQKNENSSCWIRSSQPWAGGSWGGMCIPRMGQEVVVDFLEGDPDRPLITGRVYNAEQMPPYPLPDMQTRTTIQSRSSKGGGSANYNELRFEDLKGSEQLFLNAEKDMDHRVENDHREYIGNNRHLIVNASQFELVNTDKNSHVKGKHIEKIESDMSLQVGGNQMETVTGNHSVGISGDRKTSVTGNDSCAVNGDVKEQIQGDSSIEVIGQDYREVHSDYHLAVDGTIYQSVKQDVMQSIEGMHQMDVQNGWKLSGGQLSLSADTNIVLSAEASISLVVGGNFITIGPAGVQIMGTLVLINSGGAPGVAQPPVITPPGSPKPPDKPDPPSDPTDPDTADDGSRGTKLS
jgi:type VI secretion system secreted protein VgrG